MKAKVNIGMLVAALSQAAATIDHKGNETSYVFLKASGKEGDQKLHLYSTNLTSDTLIKVPATVEEEGKLLIKADELTGCLIGRPDKDEVTLTSVADQEGKVRGLTVQYGKSKFNTTANPNADKLLGELNKLPLGQKPTSTVSGKVLSEFIRRAMFCIPTDNTGQNSVISSLHLTDSNDGYEGQATDNCIAVRLSAKVADKKPDEKIGSVKLAPLSLLPLAKLLSRRGEEVVQLVKTETRIYFRFADTVYGTTQVSGNYPSLQPILDGYEPKIEFMVVRSTLKDALTRASYFRNKDGYINLELKGTELSLSSAAGDQVTGGNDVLEVEVQKAPENGAKISVGIDYLVNITGGSQAEKLKIGLIDAVRPMIIRDPDETVNTKYVLMGVNTGA